MLSMSHRRLHPRSKAHHESEEAEEFLFSHRITHHRQRRESLSQLVLIHLI